MWGVISKNLLKHAVNYATQTVNIHPVEVYVDSIN